MVVWKVDCRGQILKGRSLRRFWAIFRERTVWTRVALLEKEMSGHIQSICWNQLGSLWAPCGLREERGIEDDFLRFSSEHLVSSSTFTKVAKKEGGITGGEIKSCFLC